MLSILFKTPIKSTKKT